MDGEKPETKQGFGDGQRGVFISCREKILFRDDCSSVIPQNSFSELHINVKAGFSAFGPTMVHYLKELSAIQKEELLNAATDHEQ